MRRPRRRAVKSASWRPPCAPAAQSASQTARSGRVQARTAQSGCARCVPMRARASVLCADAPPLCAQLAAAQRTLPGALRPTHAAPEVRLVGTLKPSAPPVRAEAARRCCRRASADPHGAWATQDGHNAPPPSAGFDRPSTRPGLPASLARGLEELDAEGGDAEEGQYPDAEAIRCAFTRAPGHGAVLCTHHVPYCVQEGQGEARARAKHIAARVRLRSASGRGGSDAGARASRDWQRLRRVQW